jgi:hypothetical protein
MLAERSMPRTLGARNYPNLHLRSGTWDSLRSARIARKRGAPSSPLVCWSNLI